MGLTEWEEIAKSELSQRYIDFFSKLSLCGRECYLRDATEILNKNCTLELSKEQKDSLDEYWKKYVKDFDSSYHKFYLNSCGYFDVKFIPDDIFAGYIDGYYNNRAVEAGFSDKNYFDLILSGFKMPVTYIHLINGVLLDRMYNPLTQSEAERILLDTAGFVVKPSVASYGGACVELHRHPKKEEVNHLLNSKHQNLIFQEIISQSETTKHLHSSSLNTVRIMTILLNDKIHTLSPIIKMGVGNSIVDNASSGGIFCRILKNGHLDNIAYNINGERFVSHPDGYNFSEVILPFMQSVQELAVRAASRFPHFRLIGWDIGINSFNEPVIIEANLTMSSIDIIQLCCGPLFGEYTDEVLQEVFCSKSGNHFMMDLTQYL